MLQMLSKKCHFLPLGLFLFVACFTLTKANCTSSEDCSGNGICESETCVCYDGWQGLQCQSCGGKVKLGTSNITISDGLDNYASGVKCSWLIDAPNSSITIHLQEFATECGWDFLYIYDGDNVNSPLLAAFSGLMYKDAYRVRKVPEVVAQSGAALVHFFSDEASNMTGFKITFKMNACPSNISEEECSGNGVCMDGVCNCIPYWEGNACHLEICPGDCGRVEGRGTCDLKNGCKCSNGYKGEDCSQLVVNGYWESVEPINGVTPSGSASHGAVEWKDKMYVTSGESYNKGSMLNIYHFKKNVWEIEKISQAPQMRYAHSTVLYDDKLFLYGGNVGNKGPTSELWEFNIQENLWNNITVRTIYCSESYMLCGPLKVAGHTATVVRNDNNKMADKMVVIFGYSPLVGYLNTVQEYYFATREWYMVKPTGYAVQGGYGHTAAWDPYTSKIYVYGGIISDEPSKNLYSYNPNSRNWASLSDAPSSRFLHTATFLNPTLMLVFGGNAQNDNQKCYNSEMMTYDTICDTWQTLSTPNKQINGDLARYGHSASTYEGTLYIYGGFDGQMLSDVIKYRPGECGHIVNKQACVNTRPGVKCVWDKKNTKCVNVKDIPRSLLDNKKVVLKCPKISKKLNVFKNQSLITADIYCPKLHTFNACFFQDRANITCTWNMSKKCIASNILNKIKPEVGLQLPPTCADHTSCQICTQCTDCLWCQNEGRCIDKNAYTSSFPYGQCREYTTNINKCRSKETNDDYDHYQKSQCGYYPTCTQCKEDPACGWCDDGSGTGLGECEPGGLTSTTCPSHLWHFTTSPVCQCNGHASCMNNSSTCLPCKHFTDGAQCEHCIPGYWGSPRNGSKCQPCECNGHATECHQDTGKCFCTTKGLIGDHCEKCDSTNNYIGDPTINIMCSYALTIDYQFTFNLSKQTDKHYTQIHFFSSTVNPDLDVDFTISCSAPAKMNLTLMEPNSNKEKVIFTAQNATSFKTLFSKDDYNFGSVDNVTMTTFHVDVYDFFTPLWIKISFSGRGISGPKLTLYDYISKLI